MAINKNGEIYECGVNTKGELANETYQDQTIYQKLDTIGKVLGVSCGNTYTAFVKQDGTVWASGDYAHGDTNIESKTKGNKPVQVGDDDTGLADTEIVLKIDQSKNLLDNMIYEFNLIYLDKNLSTNLTYESKNEEIATVNNQGIITAKRVGTTRIQAKSGIDQRIYSILVKVIEQDSVVAPKVISGEDFAGVLREDGNLWSFGYNTDGRLDVGDYLGKDIPTKTQINADYKEIKAGKSFILALKKDGTVWAVRRK